MKGLEPPRPETLDPKSNAATNYATCAGYGAKVVIFSEIAKFFLAAPGFLGEGEASRTGQTGRTGRWDEVTCRDLP